MKSTIRSLAAIALSVATATAMAATTSTGQRNLDVLDSWFTPQTAEHPDQKKADAARKDAAIAAAKAKQDRSKDSAVKPRAEPNTGMQ